MGSCVWKIVYDEYFCIKEILKAFFLNLFSMGLHFDVWAFFHFSRYFDLSFPGMWHSPLTPPSEKGSRPQTAILLLTCQAEANVALGSITNTENSKCSSDFGKIVFLF